MTMTLRLLQLALLTGSTLVLTECRKREEPPAPTLTARERFLTASDWVVSGVTQEQITASGVMTSTTVDLAAFLPCSVDNTLRYRADRTYTLDEGPLVCYDWPQTISGTWALASNETELVLTVGGNTSRLPIRRLTATTFCYVCSHDTRPDGSQFYQVQTYSIK